MKEGRGHLLTEQNNKRSKDLDKLSTLEVVDLFNEENLNPQIAVSNVKKELVKCIDEISKRIKNGGRLIYIGAGTSGRLGVLDAVECPPTFCTPPDLVQGVIAGGLNSLVQSSEGLEDSVDLAISDLEKINFGEIDCLIGITSGGTTPYVISALNYSLTLNALTICIACVPKSQIKINCNIDIRLLTGPEILTGSTRLKAGTATKMVLNIISTGVMIKLGKVYGNQMIDVSTSNKKLIERGTRIIQQILGVDKEEAYSLLEKANGSVKLSVLMSKTKLDLNSAKRLLSKNNGNIRKAIENGYS